MYGYKEKNKHYQDLLAPDHAAADFALLKSVAPNHTVIVMTGKSPERQFQSILFTLLDFKTREEIVANRRQLSSAKPAPGSDTKASDDAKKKAALEKMAAGRAAAKAKRDAEKASGVQVEKKPAKEPKVKKTDSAAAPDAAKVTDTEKKK